MSPPREPTPVRCPLCSRHPLLAMYGTDEGGAAFVHVMIYKQKRIFGNVVVTGGPVHLQCRECLRWLRIRFVRLSDVNIDEIREQDVPGSETTAPARMMDAARTA